MIIGIYANLDRDLGGKAAKALAKALSERGHEVLFDEALRSVGVNAPLYPKEELASRSQIIVVLGGDGTVLHIAKVCAEYRSRILAVNLGNLGFMSELDGIEEFNDTVGQLESGDYSIDSRGFLEITCGDQIYQALNEAVLARGARTKVVKCRVSVNGSPLSNYIADGMIISTPTGSTAYSLSAGGPVVAPDVKAMVVTPICAHTLNARPCVISDDSEVTVELLRSDDEAHLIIDGEDVRTIQEGGIIKVKRSALDVEFIRFKKYNYYRKLLAKMSSLG